MIVPRLTGAVPDLHETHATLQQPPRHQQLPRLRAGAVQVANVLRLTPHVEGVLRVVLHAVGQLERLDARLHLGVLLPLLQMALVQLVQQIQLAALLSVADGAVADVLDQAVQLRVPHVDVGALVGARQKCGLPVLRLLNGVAAGAHGDEAGQVLVLAAQAVGHPAAQARPDLSGLAAVHQQQ